MYAQGPACFLKGDKKGGRYTLSTMTVLFESCNYVEILHITKPLFYLIGHFEVNAAVIYMSVHAIHLQRIQL